MLDWKAYGKNFGAQSIAKGVVRLGLELDKKIKIGAGLTPLERASTYVNVLGGVLLPLVGDKMRASEENQDLLEDMGAHLLTKSWDYVEEYVTPASPAARRTPPPRRVPARITNSNLLPQSPAGAGVDGITVKAPVSDGGRYTRG